MGRFFLRKIGVPVYRLCFWSKRHTNRVLMPAKHKLLYVVSNRYGVHVLIIGIVAITTAVNLGGAEVRAESFGKGSMLYALVSNDDSAVIEVVSAARIAEATPSSYMDDPSIDPSAHIDFHSIGESYVTLASGDAVATTALALAEAPEAEVAEDRDEVIMYKVQDGDTLWTIAYKHNLKLSSLLWANNFTLNSVIRPGDEVKVPPIDGVIYKVKSGDTLSKIATTHKAETEKILAFNSLASANDLTIGDELVIPGGEPPAQTTTTRRTAPVTSIFTPPKTTTTTTTAPNVTADTSTNTRGSSTGSGSWVWPTDWRVITQYYGWSHTGLDIDGDYSTNSYAAAAGVVSYVGWRNGYGLTVEIDHGNGLMTRYAHHAKNYVSVGQSVSAGQAIAQTGTTGRSTGTHLHFEVIKNGRFQNPLDYVR